MPFDTKAAQELLHAIAWDHITLWHKTKTWGNGCPHARLETRKAEPARVQFLDGNPLDGSNHQKMATQALMTKSQTRLATLRQMVIDAAPALAADNASWDIELMNMPHRISARGEPEAPPFPKIVFYIYGLSFQSRRDPSKAEDPALTIAETAAHLGKIVDALSSLDLNQDHTFEIAGAWIDAASPAEALFIYETITEAGLLDESGPVAPEVKEVFDPIEVQFHMQRRFASLQV